jgi:hypothetical protein
MYGSELCGGNRTMVQLEDRRCSAPDLAGQHTYSTKQQGIAFGLQLRYSKHDLAWQLLLQNGTKPSAFSETT